jgi:hypothetical protein
MVGFHTSQIRPQRIGIVEAVGLVGIEWRVRVGLAFFIGWQGERALPDLYLSRNRLAECGEGCECQQQGKARPYLHKSPLPYAAFGPVPKR